MLLRGFDEILKMAREVETPKTLEDWFVIDLNESMLNSREHYKSKNPAFTPSSLGSCKRAQMFKLIGLDSDKSIRTGAEERRADYGSRIHELFQDYIISMDKQGKINLIRASTLIYPEGTELKPNPKGTHPVEISYYNSVHNIRTRIDGLFNYKNIPYLFEIKTENYDKWKNRFEPKADHLMQISACSLVTGIEDVLFLYVGLGVPWNVKVDLKPYFYRVTDEDRKAVTDIIADINECINNKSLPPKVTKCPPWCEWKTACMECESNKINLSEVIINAE